MRDRVAAVVLLLVLAGCEKGPATTTPVRPATAPTPPAVSTNG